MSHSFEPELQKLAEDSVFRWFLRFYKFAILPLVLLASLALGTQNYQLATTLTALLQLLAGLGALFALLGFKRCIAALERLLQRQIKA